MGYLGRSLSEEVWGDAIRSLPTVRRVMPRAQMLLTIIDMSVFVI